MVLGSSPVAVTCFLINQKESVKILHRKFESYENSLNNILIKRTDSHHEQMLILIDIIHGHAILRKKKEDISEIYRQRSDHGFSRHISLQSKMSHFWKNHETKTK